jgi:hypothetical protein
LKATQRFNDADKRNIDALRRIATNIAGKWEMSIWEDWQTPRLYWPKMHTGAAQFAGWWKASPAQVRLRQEIATPNRLYNWSHRAWCQDGQGRRHCHAR